MILRLYYDVFGSSFGIIIVSRLIMVVLLFITIYLTYRTALYWMSPAGAWIAAAGYLLMNAGYFMAHVYVRGDPIILLLLMAALYYAVPLADKRSWDRADLERLFLTFAFLGLALAISPRAGIPVLTLFLTLGGAGWGVKPPLKLIGLFFLSGLVVLLPTIVVAMPYGLEVYAFWVYKFSALLLPISSPIPNIINIIKTSFPVAILTLLGMYRVLRHKELRQRRSVLLIGALSVTGFWGLWACRHPFMQHFLMTLPFLGLMAGLGYDELFGSLQSRHWLPRWNFGRIFIFLVLLILSAKFYLFWQRRGDADLSHFLARSQWLKQYAAKDVDFAAGTAFYSPIFMPDAFYYWFGARYVSLTLPPIHKNFLPYTFDNLRERPPAFLHATFPENWYISTAPEYQSWLGTNYLPTPFKDYYIRKDIAARKVN
jgi:hypothetical protein